MPYKCQMFMKELTTSKVITQIMFGARIKTCSMDQKGPH